jgi:ABC-type transporter Mla MlaB component
MNEHAMHSKIGERARSLPVVGSRKPLWKPDRADLVVDLSGIQELDVTNLALLLTAQQNAQKEDRAVWLAGVPMGVWQTLHEMGLGRFFKPFPVSAKVIT